MTWAKCCCLRWVCLQIFAILDPIWYWTEPARPESLGSTGTENLSVDPPQAQKCLLGISIVRDWLHHVWTYVVKCFRKLFCTIDKCQLQQQRLQASECNRINPTGPILIKLTLKTKQKDSRSYPFHSNSPVNICQCLRTTGNPQIATVHDLVISLYQDMPDQSPMQINANQ